MAAGDDDDVGPLGDEQLAGRARPRAPRDVDLDVEARELGVGPELVGQRDAIDHRVAASAEHDAHGRYGSLGPAAGHLTAAGLRSLAFCGSAGLPTPARSLASCFLCSMFDWRAIMMRCACGEPAPCIDSVR